MQENKLHLIGYASGIAGVDKRCGDGPIVLQHSPYLSELKNQGISFQWDTIISPLPSQQLPLNESVSKLCEELAKNVSQAVKNRNRFCVIAGDHSCAIGTWSGVYDALHHQGEIGLIWIDAHMDSHTPETSESGRIHGMPLANLLGYGYDTLTGILHRAPKLKPENVCLIGVRSFESGEAELLKRLNVRIYFMDEVKKRGFDTVFQEAVQHVSKHTIGYGISLDIDGIDPEEAPGVDVPEPDGIHANDISRCLKEAMSDPQLIATEIVEFDPSRDQEHKTEKLVAGFLGMLAKQT